MTYTEFYATNKDAVLILTLNEYHSIRFVDYYNSISGTYLGWSIHSFIGALKHFINNYPELFEQLDDYRRLPKLLEKAGFVKREPTELEIRLYGERTD